MQFSASMTLTGWSMSNWRRAHESEMRVSQSVLVRAHRRRFTTHQGSKMGRLTPQVSSHPSWILVNWSTQTSLVTERGVPGCRSDEGQRANVLSSARWEATVVQSWQRSERRARRQSSRRGNEGEEGGRTFLLAALYNSTASS